MIVHSTPSCTGGNPELMGIETGYSLCSHPDTTPKTYSQLQNSIKHAESLGAKLRYPMQRNHPALPRPCPSSLSHTIKRSHNGSLWLGAFWNDFSAIDGDAFETPLAAAAVVPPPREATTLASRYAQGFAAARSYAPAPSRQPAPCSGAGRLCHHPPLSTLLQRRRLFVLSTLTTGRKSPRSSGYRGCSADELSCAAGSRGGWTYSSLRLRLRLRLRLAKLSSLADSWPGLDWIRSREVLSGISYGIACSNAGLFPALGL